MIINHRKERSRVHHHWWQVLYRQHLGRSLGEGVVPSNVAAAVLSLGRHSAVECLSCDANRICSSGSNATGLVAAARMPTFEMINHAECHLRES